MASSRTKSIEGSGGPLLPARREVSAGRVSRRLGRAPGAEGTVHLQGDRKTHSSDNTETARLDLAKTTNPKTNARSRSW